MCIIRFDLVLSISVLYTLLSLFFLKTKTMSFSDGAIGTPSGGLQLPSGNSNGNDEDEQLLSEDGGAPEVQYEHELFGNGRGMWNHLASDGNGIEETKNQVFKRVEDPARPHTYAPNLLAPGYMIDPNDLKKGTPNDPNGYYIDFKDAIKYSATGTSTAAEKERAGTLLRYMNAQVQRGEWRRKANAPIRWENSGDSSSQHYCTHTLFPVKFTRSYAKKIDTFFMSYYVFYSSMPIKPVGFDPSYKDFVLSPDATVDGVGASATVKVDMTLINDENAILAIISSCQNSYAKSGSYITFIPRIDESLYTSSVNWSSPSRYTFGGSSCGMAVFAAIKGWMSVLYTGYLNAPVPGGKFVTNEEVRETMVKQRYGGTTGFRDNAGGFQSSYQDEPWYLRASDQPARLPGQSIATAPSVISRYMAQPNFVESVGAIFSKIIYATAHHIPIFIPMQSSFRTDMASYIARFRSSAKAIQWMGIVPTCYTAAMMEDGYPMITRSDTNNVLNIAPNIFMPLTVTDASLMQLRFMAVSAFDANIDAEVGFAGGAINREAQLKMFRTSRTNMINLAANEAEKRYNENAPERRAVEQARLRAKREGLDRPAKYSLLQATKQPFKVARDDQREKKLEAKRQVTNRVKLEVKKIQDAIKQRKMNIQDAMKELKNKYMEIKKPNDAERAQYALDMKKLRDSKPVGVKKQYARIKDMTPQSVKFKKQADNTYSEATKAAMKQLKDRNDRVITQFPAKNPGVTTAESRKRLANERAEQAKKDKAALERYRERFNSAEGQGNFAGLRRTRDGETSASARGIIGDVAHGVGDVLDILDL